ncbi:hypothetical protein ABBQ38_013548 [Trebouxia sp. C0009 RCD-2024]
MLAAATSIAAYRSPCISASPQNHSRAAAPHMSARRMKQIVLRRLYQGSAVQQSAPKSTLTGLQQARNMQSMATAQPAPQVQQISQWWERQWHVQDPTYQQQDKHQTLSQFHIQQQQQQQQQQQHRQRSRHQTQQQPPRAKSQITQVQQQLAGKQHAINQHREVQAQPSPAQAAQTGTSSRQPATARLKVSSKRRRGRPNIVSASSAAASSSSARGTAASLRATRNFKAVLAGNRFRKMDTAAELLAQAHTLQSLQRDQAAEQAFQQHLHLKAHPQLAQRHPDSASEAMPSSHPSASGSSQLRTPHPVLSQLPNSHTEGALTDQAGAVGGEARVAAARQDMESVALDIVESQLPLWSRKPALDWSAQQHLSRYQAQAKMSSTSDSKLPVLTKFSLEERGEQVEVQPVWVLVHQEHPWGPARLYETVHTVYPELLEHITTAVEPFCHAEGMTFSNPKFSHGPWKGYLVGAVGEVAACEDDALWPNRMFCDKRVMHNVRNGWDIAKFLAEPSMADMAGHHANLKLIQEDRHYQARWVWRMLSSRWGEDAVAAYCASKQAAQSLQPAGRPAASPAARPAGRPAARPVAQPTARVASMQAPSDFHNVQYA